jgi:hypothetical protein
MSEPQLLFTEAEWSTEVPKVVQAMHDYVGSFSAPISKDHGTCGELWGSGTYLKLGERTFLLTNDHVARVRPSTALIHQIAGQDDLYRISGDHMSHGWPLDIALLPVSKSVWDASTHKGKAITIDLISIAHEPAPTELLTFAGCSGERSKFLFDTLVTPGTSSTAREVALPDHEDCKSRFHFGIDYKPDLATNVVGSRGLPKPPRWCVFSDGRGWGRGRGELASTALYGVGIPAFDCPPGGLAQSPSSAFRALRDWTQEQNGAGADRLPPGGAPISSG